MKWNEMINYQHYRKKKKINNDIKILLIFSVCIFYVTFKTNFRSLKKTNFRHAIAYSLDATIYYLPSYVLEKFGFFCLF